MSDPDTWNRAAQAERWIQFAMDDTDAAQVCLDRNPPLLGPAAYHCQQASEKLLKGCLVLGCVEFRRTHDLHWLSELATGAYPELAPFVAGMAAWTAWGVAHRYPGDEQAHSKPTPERVARALETIHALREAVQTLVRQTRDGTATA
jgi:HEPN domain-containing protein